MSIFSKNLSEICSSEIGPAVQKSFKVWVPLTNFEEFFTAYVEDKSLVFRYTVKRFESWCLDSQFICCVGFYKNLVVSIPTSFRESNHFKLHSLITFFIEAMALERACTLHNEYHFIDVLIHTNDGLTHSV